MVRALWSAATGMIAQQNNVDTIANNLANVNTAGYKTEVNEFKSLLYQTIQTKTTTHNGETKPVGAQVGLGVRNAAIVSQFTQGSFQASESDTAFAISGDGFFGVRGEDGKTYYTRNGNFLFAMNDANTVCLANTDGLKVLNTAGQPIQIPANYMANKIEVSATGQLLYPDAANNLQPIAGAQIGRILAGKEDGQPRAGCLVKNFAGNAPRGAHDAVFQRKALDKGRRHRLV